MESQLPEYLTHLHVAARARQLLFLCLVMWSPSGFPSDPQPRSQLKITESLEINDETRLFTQALKSSGLWLTLLESTQVTLLLPKDKALRNEGADFLLEEVLLKPENSERLADLMAQHVYTGIRLTRKSFENSTTLKNKLGGCVSVEKQSKDALRIGPEAVVTSHLSFVNGEIYFIDRLLWHPYPEQDSCLK